jgi:OPA family sugar phosphate sensor protein UhpC-like MFS transporter
VFGRIFSPLKPAPYKPIETDYKYWMGIVYNHWRMRVCFSIFFGYALFYFTRKSFTFAMPFMAESLGYTKAELGILASILYITYGISKFVSGVSADRSNPRYFMAFGLIMTGILNILFGMSSSIWMLGFFWALNGWFQAWGWPASCKLLNFWYEKSERGFWYSICSASHNLGGAIIPLLSVHCAMTYGWRYAMFIPAIISITMGIILIFLLRDVPRTLKLPTVEDFKLEPNEYTDLVEVKKHPSLSMREITKLVLLNKYVWIFAIAYFFVYVVRTAINDWTMFYLIEVKDASTMFAGFGITSFEVGGFVGMLLAGILSDTIWKGNRIPSMVICAFGLVFSVLGLWYLPPGSIYLDLTLLALIGAFVFGPQMIIGLAAAEYVDKRASSAANGFTGTLGYFGAAFAGFPIGKMIDTWGWDGFFLAQAICAIAVCTLLLPLWTNKYNSENDKDDDKLWDKPSTSTEPA